VEILKRSVADRSVPNTKGDFMPEKQTVERASNAKRKGKSASTQAGEFIREEMHHIREGKHGARSTKQAIAIGLSKARRAGVNLPPPEKGTVSEKTRRSAKQAYQAGQRRKPKTSRRRSRAIELALKREPRRAASRKALSRRRVPRRESARGPNARLRHAERREPKGGGDVPSLLAKRLGLVRDADRRLFCSLSTPL
jgi:hypothetical protein